LKSPEAVPLGVEFIQVYLDLAKEIGSEVPKEETTESKNTDALLKMFTFDKKRELEQYCRTIVIDSSAFANFTLACELTGSPFIHEIHYRDLSLIHIFQHATDFCSPLCAGGNDGHRCHRRQEITAPRSPPRRHASGVVVRLKCWSAAKFRDIEICRL